jgi:protein quaking
METSLMITGKMGGFSGSSGSPCDCNNSNTSPDYLAQLLKDRRQMQAFNNVFIHLGRILEEEISRVRESLFQQQVISKETLHLPEQFGPLVVLSEKLFIPVKEYPDFNFVGRILGPRGMTTKQIESITGCKIMIRGKGSMRDRKKEELNRGKPNWEHLSEDLHVLITVEDTQERAAIRLKRAVEEVKKLLVPLPEGEDDLKKLQLMELAIMNGTYRDNNTLQLFTAHNHAAFLLAGPPFPANFALPPMIRPSDMIPAGPAGAPIILAPRMQIQPQHQQQSVSPICGSVPSSPGSPPGQFLPIGDLPPPSYFVQFDPGYLQTPPPSMSMSMPPTPTTHGPHQMAFFEQHIPAPNVTYVR